jgi:uncharacterized protein (TIGR00369 family)
MPMTSPADLPVPEGFEPCNRGGPYFAALGPLFMKPTPEGGAVIALRVEHKHTNLAGMTHGGMLATLADGAFGINIAMLRKRHTGQVTVSLNMDYLSAAHQGDWLEAHVLVRRIGRQLAFAECLLKVEERVVLRANAVFAFITQRPAAIPTPPPDAQDG